MDEDGELENRVGIEMAKLNLVEVEETAKKGMCGEAKPPLEERLQHNSLIGLRGGEFLTCHWPPSHGCLI